MQNDSIPTVWDDAKTANEKLKTGGIASKLIGNSKSGKIATGLSNSTVSTSSKSINTTDSATLSDVVKAINKLEKSNSEMQCTVTSILKTDNLTLAKATVKGINAITKANGKSPLEG